eukprot:6095905-Amphidinium_carterae.1
MWSHQLQHSALGRMFSTLMYECVASCACSHTSYWHKSTAATAAGSRTEVARSCDPLEVSAWGLSFSRLLTDGVALQSVALTGRLLMEDAFASRVASPQITLLACKSSFSYEG